MNFRVYVLRFVLSSNSGRYLTFLLRETGFSQIGFLSFYGIILQLIKLYKCRISFSFRVIFVFFISFKLWIYVLIGLFVWRIVCRCLVKTITLTLREDNVILGCLPISYRGNGGCDITFGTDYSLFFPFLYLKLFSLFHRNILYGFYQVTIFILIKNFSVVPTSNYSCYKFIVIERIRHY